MIDMAKRKPKPDARRGDRHKKVQTQLRLHPLMRHQLDELVGRRLSTLAEEITEAVREHLKKHDLWPPSDEVRAQFTDE